MDPTRFSRIISEGNFEGLRAAREWLDDLRIKVDKQLAQVDAELKNPFAQTTAGMLHCKCGPALQTFYLIHSLSLFYSFSLLHVFSFRVAPPCPVVCF